MYYVMFAYMLSLSFWVFVHWSYFYQLYVMFSISSFVSFDEIYARLYT